MVTILNLWKCLRRHLYTFFLQRKKMLQNTVQTCVCIITPWFHTVQTCVCIITRWFPDLPAHASPGSVCFSKSPRVPPHWKMKLLTNPADRGESWNKTILPQMKNLHWKDMKGFVRWQSEWNGNHWAPPMNMLINLINIHYALKHI